jgi:hypothetical protein
MICALFPLGSLIQDTVRLGELTAKHQVFAEAVTVSDNFVKPQVPIDGIVGFGFQGTSS